MTRLLLIRHGVTEWNKARRYCGRKDIGLSRQGRDQIKRLSDRLTTAGINKIYCSDRKRAMQSARILFKGERIIRYGKLREIDFGILEGLRHKEIMKKHASVYKKWLEDSFKNEIPGTEPMNAFQKRVESAIQKIIMSNSGKTIAIVCHGGVIGIFVKGILKKRSFWCCVPSAASITVVEHDGKKTRLKKFNDTAHLR